MIAKFGKTPGKLACCLACAAGLLALRTGNVTAADGMDRRLPVYKQVAGLSGTLNSVGSDTLENLMEYWMQELRKLYPNVKTQMEAKGSSTAPPALIAGTAQLGPMSRKMKPGEVDAFKKKYGFAPTRFAVAVDCLAVFVNKDNPLPGLTLPQLDAIFSKTRRLGLPQDIITWGQLGLDGKWKNLPISIYGRNSISGTYAFFKKHALGKGDYKNTVKEQPGSAAVVNGVARELGAIGYSGIGYRSSGVRVVPLSRKPGQPLVQATFTNAMTGKYPLGRSLYVYVVKVPGRPLPRLVNEMLRFILSRQGQEQVLKAGYGPLPYKVVRKQLKLLEGRLGHPKSRLPGTPTAEATAK